MEQNQQSTAEQYSEQIEQLMELGRTQGYLTYAEINDLLPEDLIDPEYYDKLLQTLQHDAGIPVLDEAPESDEMMLNDTIPDEDAVEEATQILSNVESEIGRTTDPVRMYMREMGTVDLLTREDEISIAKRIEEGIDEVQTAIAAYPEALTELLDNYDQVEYLRASGSMPFVSHIIQVNGHEYLDGGCSDSIPIKKMLEMDVDKIIVVLTRPLDYRKKPSNKHLNKLFYHQYPHFVETLNNRYLNYNASLDLITKLEKEKKIFVLRPSQLIPIGRLEKDKEVIQQMYDLGVSDCNNQLENLKKYLRG